MTSASMNNIPNEAVEAAAKALAVQAWSEWEYVPDELRRLFLRDAKTALEAAAPHMAAEYRRGYRDGLADRKQVTADPREWEPGDPIE